MQYENWEISGFGRKTGMVHCFRPPADAKEAWTRSQCCSEAVFWLMSQMLLLQHLRDHILAAWDVLLEGWLPWLPYGEGTSDSLLFPQLGSAPVAFKSK